MNKNVEITPHNITLIYKNKQNFFPTELLIDKSEGDKGYRASLFAALVGILRGKCYKETWTLTCIMVKKPKF